MAATDQFYRRQKTLNVVFGVSCGLLLAVTLWMLADDYLAGWKKEQRLFRDVEAALAERETIALLPEKDSIKANIRAVKEARAHLEATRGKVAAEERRINAKKERQNVRYQGIKADFDSLMTYYNTSLREYTETPETSPAKDRLGRVVQRQREELDRLGNQLDEAQR